MTNILILAVAGLRRYAARMRNPKKRPDREGTASMLMGYVAVASGAMSDVGGRAIARSRIRNASPDVAKTDPVWDDERLSRIALEIRQAVGEGAYTDLTGLSDDALLSELLRK